MELKSNETRLYKDLAWVWPLISPPEDYLDEATEFFEQIQKECQINAKTLLDIGCGGGHIDFHLKKHFSVTGVDISTNMLALAKKLNPEVTYIKGDMRTISIKDKFDAVIIADSIDYMQTKEDLRDAFKTAFQHLNPGGVFCTYAEEVREKFKQNKTKTNAFSQGDISITTIENSFDPDPTDSTFEFILIYIIRRNGSLSIEHDLHIMGLFDTNTWIEVLEECGFTIRIIEYDKVGPMFVCVKPT